jgi:hypothetical protein
MRELESIRLKALKILVDDKIIKNGRLRGVEREIIMAEVEKYADEFYIYCIHFYQYYGMY